MKWLVYYSRFYCIGKGEPCSEHTIIGYSDLDEKDLFNTLQKEYPNLPIRKKVKKENSYLNDYLDENNKDDLPYSDFVFFTSNNLKQF